jgi:hypothetical protein
VCQGGITTLLPPDHTRLTTTFILPSVMLVRCEGCAPAEFTSVALLVSHTGILTGRVASCGNRASLLYSTP